MCGVDDDGLPYDTPVNLLSEHICELTEENRELQDRNDTLQARLGEIRQQLQDNKKLIKESDDQKDTLTKKNAELEKELLATKVYYYVHVVFSYIFDKLFVMLHLVLFFA